MPLDTGPARNTANNIGLMRLVLASCVILGHSPELVDGTRAREPLTMLFGTISLGEVSVDGFFLLSGFLITGSMLSPGMTLGRFAQRRVLRIVPGYAVAYLLSVVVLGGLIGAGIAGDWLSVLIHLVLLAPPPEGPEVFPTLHWHLLNGSLWTIAYEFRCYMLVGAMGAAGILARRRVVLGLLVAMLATFLMIHHPGIAWRVKYIPRAPFNLLVGWADDSLRLTTVFMVGCCVRLYRREFFSLLDRPVIVGVASALLIPLFYFQPTAELALITFGSLPFFWVALRAPLGRLGRVNTEVDISYGVYLYGWPVGLTIVWFNPAISPIVLASVTLALAALMGAASWYGVEQWFKPAERIQREAVASYG